MELPLVKLKRNAHKGKSIVFRSSITLFSAARVALSVGFWWLTTIKFWPPIPCFLHHMMS